MTLCSKFKRPSTPAVGVPPQPAIVNLTSHQKGICEAIWRCYKTEGLDYTRANIKTFSNDDERREAIARYVRDCPSDRRCTIIERELFLRGPLPHGYGQRWTVKRQKLESGPPPFSGV